MGLDAVYPEIDVGLAKHSTVVSVAWGKDPTAKNKLLTTCVRSKSKTGNWNNYENGNPNKTGKIEIVE